MSHGNGITCEGNPHVVDGVSIKMVINRGVYVFYAVIIPAEQTVGKSVIRDT